MSETSIKIIKNEVGCRDEMCYFIFINKLLRPPPFIFVFGSCGRLLDTHTPTSQDFLVSLLFGTVSSLHPSSFLYLYNVTLLH